MSKQTDAIARGPIFPLVVRLTIPAVVAQLITFLYNIVDRMYVAGIPDGGMDALAALGIVLPVTLILTSLAHLVGLGGAPRAGIRMGEKNLPEANRIFGTAFVLLCGIGLFAGVVTFLFARRIVILFGCPASAAAYVESYLKLYALRIRFRHAVPGDESVYSDAGLFRHGDGIGFVRSDLQHRTGSRVHLCV